MYFKKGKLVNTEAATLVHLKRVRKIKYFSTIYVFATNWIVYDELLKYCCVRFFGNVSSLYVERDIFLCATWKISGKLYL